MIDHHPEIPVILTLCGKGGFFAVKEKKTFILAEKVDPAETTGIGDTSMVTSATKLPW